MKKVKKVTFMYNTGRKWKDGYIRFSKDKIVPNEGRYLIKWIGKEMGFQLMVILRETERGIYVCGRQT